MVFIKGAWLDPWVNIFPWDPRWQEYFCCPQTRVTHLSHIETFNPATGSGEKHDPPQWITLHCPLTADKDQIFGRELQVPDDHRWYVTIRPDWCPLRSRSPPE